MKYDKLMVIGGGYWQIPIIKLAKSLGYTVVCTNLYDDSPAFAYADKFYVVNILDKEKNLQIAREENIQAVVTDQSDIAVKTAAYIADILGLPGQGLDIADLYTNKYRMRNEIKSTGLHHPKYQLCSSVKELEEFRDSTIHDTIIKPPSSQASRGVFKITKSEKLDRSVVESCINYSDDGNYLVEEYITGTEITVEGYKTHTHHTTLAISRKNHYEHNPNVAKSLVYTHEPIAGLSLKDIAKINDNIFNHVPYGITHVEYIIHDKKMYLVEAAIRGGGTNVSATVIPNVSGVDVNKLLIDDASGVCTSTKIKPTGKINRTPVSLNFFNFKPGPVKSISGEDFLINCDNVIEYKFNISKGDNIKNPEDDATRHGYYITTASTTEELISINNKVHSIVDVTYNQC